MDLDPGKVLLRSMGIWLRNFVPFTILALLIQAPLVAVAFHGPFRSGRARELELATQLLPQVLSLVTAGAVAFGVFHQLRGARAGFLQCVRAGLRSFARVIGVALVVALAIGAAFAGAIALAVLYWRGFLVLLIPAAILWCGFWVAVPAAVVEGQGVVAAITRSMILTRGARIPIFVTLVILALLGFAVRAVVADTVPAAIVSGILGGLSAVASVVVYTELRSQKEKVALEEMAAVFD